jgi:zinc transport system substrate-binding protein
LFSLLSFLLILLPTLPIPTADASDPLVVYTVNYPLKYFAERIAGKHAAVVFPAPRDGDPAHWIPNIEIISKYQQADLILLNGANYAKWIGKVSLARSKLVDTSRKFRDRYIVMEEAVTHSHGPGGKHAHESTAFTIWIDLDLALKQAEAIAIAFSRKRPGLRDLFKRNFMALYEDLAALDREIKTIVSKNPSRPLVASHPVYHYMARRYGLNIRSVHWEPDAPPNNEQWMALNALLKDHPAKWMIWEGAPLKTSVDKLQSIRINSLVFDPCGNVPEKGDFLTVMRENVQNLKPAFQ